MSSRSRSSSTRSGIHTSHSKRSKYDDVSTKGIIFVYAMSGTCTIIYTIDDDNVSTVVTSRTRPSSDRGKVLIM